MEELRDKLYKSIEIHGLNYDEIIAADRELHNEIIMQQREMMKGVK